MSRVSSRKVGKLAGVEALLPLLARVEQLAAAAVEPLVQLGEEVERGFGQDLVGAADARRFGNDARDGRARRSL